MHLLFYALLITVRASWSIQRGQVKLVILRDLEGVGRGGLEPPWVSPLDPKSSAYANSAIYPLFMKRAFTDSPQGSDIPYPEPE